MARPAQHCDERPNSRPGRPLRLRLLALVGAAIVALTMVGCNFHVPIPTLMVELLTH